jgi:uncharacterized membrane protein (DUF106 family)
MEQAIIVILSILGPSVVVCIAGIIYGLYINKKEQAQ